MTTPTILDDDSPFRLLVERIDPTWRLRRIWPMTGGVSAQVTAIEIERPDSEQVKLIVRQHGAADRAHNPHIARDEHRLLTIAQAHGLAAPRPYYVDDSCDLFAHPVVVIEFIDGTTVFDPVDRRSFLSRMAAELVNIHTVRDMAELSFLPSQGRGPGDPTGVLDTAMGEGRIREVLASMHAPRQPNPPALLHGDYWPGNILWRNGTLAAVIDWEDAGTGDPLSDLGNARMELLFALGSDAMHEFTDLYLSMATIDIDDLPRWDLCAALRPCSKLSTWGLHAAVEQQLRERHALFVRDAIDRAGRRQNG
jgi:aminoglycoside phosphotransferase (APT) family kinase protein